MLAIVALRIQEDMFLKFWPSVGPEEVLTLFLPTSHQLPAQSSEEGEGDLKVDTWDPPMS